nr:MAG TPA: hypothetical protein [Caudoviricetes sp.]
MIGLYAKAGSQYRQLNLEVTMEVYHEKSN